MDVGFKTDKGVRRTNNEDAFFVMKKDGVYIVADGVGGNNSGEIASRTAVSEIAQYVEENEMPHKDKDIEFFFEQAVGRANCRVYDMARRYKENQGMATTVVIAYLNGKKLHITNVGDSRAYLYTDGVLQQITEDHTYVNALVRAGVISKDQARTHEDKNMITKAIGAEAAVEADHFTVKVRSGDRILLCTDGLYDKVNEEDIGAIFAMGMSMTDTCVRLVDAANGNGGGDNITAICIEITEDDII